jgi:hypothetical protein
MKSVTNRTCQMNLSGAVTRWTSLAIRFRFASVRVSKIASCFSPVKRPYALSLRQSSRSQ